MDAAELAVGLRRFAAQDLTADGIHAALQASADACVAIFQVTGSGVMIADEQNTIRYVAASNADSKVLETAENATGQGPSTEAFITLRPVASNDVTQDQRWPKLAEAVAGHDVHAVLGAPMRLGGVAVGTVDVYRDRPGDWSDAELAGLQQYSDIVSRTLSAVLAARRAEELADQLQYALDHRAVIERAVGFVMASRGLDAVAAFNTLRTAARSDRRKIGEVAEELLSTGRLPRREG